MQEKGKLRDRKKKAKINKKWKLVHKYFVHFQITYNVCAVSYLNIRKKSKRRRKRNEKKRNVRIK